MLHLLRGIGDALEATKVQFVSELMKSQALNVVLHRLDFLEFNVELLLEKSLLLLEGKLFGRGRSNSRAFHSFLHLAAEVRALISPKISVNSLILSRCGRVRFGGRCFLGWHLKLLEELQLGLLSFEEVFHIKVYSRLLRTLDQLMMMLRLGVQEVGIDIKPGKRPPVLLEIDEEDIGSLLSLMLYLLLPRVKYLFRLPIALFV